MSHQVVTVAFSGGKDSTAAILLLREQGYEVRALTMRLGITDEGEKLARIEKLARVLDVPWHLCDVRAVFQEKVLDYFVNAYRGGLTPNPCVRCNRFIKFDLLLAEMEKKSPGGFFASGHYADKLSCAGRWFLREPVDRGKSQIYFLAMIEPTVLEKVMFPIAALSSGQVRTKVAGLPLANDKESQDVCFLQDENLASFLSRRIPESFVEGDIIDLQGEKIGRHRGAAHFTKGQRRGTRFASDRKLYVVGRDMEANTVTLGTEQDLLSDSLTVTQSVFWRPLRAGETLLLKVRYQLHGYEAEITAVAATRIHAVFNKPVRAVTPGQLAVFYDGDIIVAAGTIE
jgi:tRNA-specific 2-thiouridylase